MVRAKVIVTSKADNFNSYDKSKTSVVTLSPVSGDTPENKTWSKWTPSGKIELNITNPEAVDAFVLGAEYFVDFTPAAQKE